MGRTIALLVTVGVVWAGIYYAHWVCVRRRFVMITPGQLYQSARMEPHRLIRCARRHQIEVVIDFRGPSEVHAEAQALAAAGIRHINIPVCTNPSAEAIRRFVEVVLVERNAGRRVLLHCKDGEGRAIAFAAIYRIEFEGWSAQQAYRAATRLPPGFRFVSMLFPRAGLLSPRNRKTPLILNYRPTLDPVQRAAQRPGLHGAESRQPAPNEPARPEATI
jgi:protein-tyrosine phosphatase